MATVRDASTQNAKDKSYSGPSRTVATTPVNALTPDFFGEIVQFTSAAGTTYYRATGVTTGDWSRCTRDGKDL